MPHVTRTGQKQLLKLSREISLDLTICLPHILKQAAASGSFGRSQIIEQAEMVSADPQSHPDASALLSEED